MAKNAIELLKQDHEDVRELLEKLVTESSAKKRSALLAEITEALRVHTRIEEEIFYPAFREAGGEDHERTFFEAQEEHRAVEKLVLPDLEETDPSGHEFVGRAKVLKELVDHHADEEEAEMFAMAEDALSDEELEDLAEKMEALKEELGL